MLREASMGGLVLPHAGVSVLRAGAETSPLFVIGAPPDAGDERFTTLLGQLDVSLPVISLDLDALQGLRTLQGMAGRLAETMRAVQPQGAFRIACAAPIGRLAYEAALQLAGTDRAIALLALCPIDRSPGSLAQHAIASAMRDYEVLPSPLRLHCFGAAAEAHSWSKAAAPDRLHIHEVHGIADFGRKLGQVLQQSTGVSMAPAARSDALLTIQSGRSDQAPVFCLPGAGASVIDFVPLAMALGSTVPVHGFQPRGMDGTSLPHSSVEAAAATCVRELERACPRGGVHLVGHSFGGWVAFEIARLLQARGRSLLSLTVLDSDVPGGFGLVGQEYTRAEALLELAALFEQAAQRPIGVTLDALRERSAESQLQLLHSRLVAVGLMPRRSSAESLNGTARCFESALRTCYHPSGPVTGVARLALVRRSGESTDDARRRHAAITAGWQCRLPGLTQRLMPGNHLSLLKAPHIGTVADWMRAPTPQSAAAPAPRLSESAQA
jgi:thioesterase domain-containing protein